MAVTVSITSCCWVDCEMAALFLVQVTVVAGPPEEMQVKVLVANSYSNEVILVGKPAPHDNIRFHQFGGNLTLFIFIDPNIHGYILLT